ncbi:hypothetical protein FOMCTCXJ_CDS_0030 [Pseudomonas phage Athelas]|nr:hypothetical protein FOMCTCXJ_CDS_0030 [Pseudomonas phage Athelas]
MEPLEVIRDPELVHVLRVAIFEARTKGTCTSTFRASVCHQKSP